MTWAILRIMTRARASTPATAMQVRNGRHVLCCFPKLAVCPVDTRDLPSLARMGAGEAEFLEVRLMGSATVPRVGWVEGFDEMIVTTFRELDV